MSHINVNDRKHQIADDTQMMLFSILRVIWFINVTRQRAETHGTNNKDNTGESERKH